MQCIGSLESQDDFYVMDSKLVLLQTTINVFNASLFDLVSPQANLAWQRVRIANMMANTGRQWYKVFKMYNSGKLPKNTELMSCYANVTLHYSG